MLENQRVKFFNSEATNKLITVGKKDLKINQDTNTAKIEKGGLVVEFEKYELGKSVVRGSMWKVFDILLIEFTKNNDYKSKNIDYVVTLTIEEIALKLGYDVKLNKELTGEELEKEKKRIAFNLKNANKAITKDLNLLFGVYLTWKGENSKKKTEDISRVRIMPELTIKNRRVNAVLGYSLAQYLVNSYIGKYNLNVLKTSGNNPLAYQLGLKLISHHNINLIKKNHNGQKLGIKKIIAGVGELPSLADLNDPTHWKRYIKEPIEKSLKQLTELEVVKEWYYQNKAGDILKMEDLKKISCLDYEKLYLCFELY